MSGRTLPRVGILGLAAGYSCIYSMLIPIARELGYALAIHGSLARDLDLIAIPWTPEASDALTLVKALKAATSTVTHNQDADHYFPDLAPTTKPHGRVAYSLHFTNFGGDGAYVDVSVMPRC